MINQFPEKVLQFGTGILLRGLPDYFIDEANKKGIFKGKIVVVKSTPGDAADFEKYQNRYTTCVRGIVKGKEIVENVDNDSISRVLLAESAWSDILAAACSPELEIIISNTTEVGIQFEPESILQNPPKSFPAKLTAVLHERFKKIGNETKKLVVIPTELLPDNAIQLRKIVLQLIEHNNLGNDFITWLDKYVLFCNSLVDRIVTKPSEIVRNSFPSANALTIQAEPYKIWVIEGNAEIREVLSFAAASDGVVITENIEYYRERKLRLLNGTHTISVCLGFLKGFQTVYECTQDPEMGTFIQDVMLKEIEPTLLPGMRDENKQFAMEVLDRFSNPFTAHRLLSITLQATMKMKMRNVPTLFRFVESFGKVPDLMAKGFAAYLLFMKVTHVEGTQYFGTRRREPYAIQDDQAKYFYEIWRNVESGNDGLKKLAVKVCQETSLWDRDLTSLPKFTERVTWHLEELTKL